jgi:hypothetical protein
MKATHPLYICNAKNKMLKINNGSHKDKNVAAIQNMMLSSS